MEREELIGLLQSKLEHSLVRIEEMANNDILMEIRKDDLIAVMGRLKKDEDLRFTALMNQLGVDYGEHFAVIYNLYSFHLDRKLTVKAFVDKDNPEVDSVEYIFKGVNWFERETYDLMGIRFRGHSNLERLLLPPDWEGHPLRKDYVYPETYQGLELRRRPLLEE